MARHTLTKEDRQKGFRNAIEAVQIKHGLDFNEAVQWLLRKSARQAGYNGNWQQYREDRNNGNNPYGIKECWHFKDAKVCDSKFYPSIHSTNKDMILKRKTLNCYRG